MTPTESTATINGLKFRLLRGGRGTPVLFLHGANGFPGWLPLFERLSADHDVIVPEHPGFGASDDAPGLVNVSDFAFYYLDFLEQMNLPEVHVIGHSLGGWISAEIAIRDRSRLASLTLLAPAGVRIKGVPTGDNFIWTPDEAARLVVYDQALAEQAIARVLTSEEQDQMIRTRLMAARLGSAGSRAGSIRIWKSGCTASAREPWSFGAARTICCRPPTRVSGRTSCPTSSARSSMSAAIRRTSSSLSRSSPS
jgi:pimeloyl-ACP methyl ester carboxylesterase